jgi:UPF0755 protein
LGLKFRKAISLVILGGVLGGIYGFNLWMNRNLAPMPQTESEYFHLDHPEKIGQALGQLSNRQIVRNPNALAIVAWFQRRPKMVRAGTYRVNGGMKYGELLDAIFSPIHMKFRFPETNWARRSANLLQRADICSAKHYLALVNDPQRFSRDVRGFNLPIHTLEGYLYPDTYDLPPLSGAYTVVERQLRAFQNKVVKPLGPVAASEEVICKASLVELETGTDDDRARIAGVIDNRLAKGIPLQIDAGIEYALGKWRRLFFKDYKNVKSPYNLYLHKGLPPTPICSPSFKSIYAVLHPLRHDYLYYVALPNGHSLFARTPAEHEHNIRLRKLALQESKKKKQDLNKLFPAVPTPAEPGDHKK